MSNGEYTKEWETEELDAYAEEVLTTVSKNVKKFREAKGYSQMQLSLDIGLSGGSQLGRAELRSRNHHFNIKHLAKISKILKIDIEEFFKE